MTVAEAADRSSQAFSEIVSEADIFLFALTGFLTLSVRFPTPVRAIALTADSWQRIARGDRDFDLYEECGDTTFDMRGEVCDLPNPMTGVERFDVEHEYQQRTGGPAIEAPPLARPTRGPFVMLGSCPLWLQCDEVPGTGLTQPYSSGLYMPPDRVFVVRPAALEQLVPSHANPSASLPSATGDGSNAIEPAITSPQTPKLPALTKTDVVGGPRMAAWLEA